MIRDEATPHTLLTIQLAEIIGQLQHLIDLSEAASGRNIYDPLVIDLSVALSQTVPLPSESHTIVGVTLSSDTAATIKLFLVEPRSYPVGTLIGQVYIPAGASGVAVRLNCPVRPVAAWLKITTSAAVVNGACVVTLRRERPGGYPDVG